MAILFNNCKQMRMTNAFNQRPRGMLMESAQGVRSTAKGKNEESPGRSLLQTERFKFFPATGRVGGSAAFQFYSLDFFITHRFFVTFFPKESNVSFVPLILSPRYCAHLPIY